MSSLVPANVTALLQMAFATADAYGMCEDVQIYGRQTVRDGSGDPAARGLTLLGTLRAYVDDGGGSMSFAVEGQRLTAIQTIYFPLSPLLTTALYGQRMALLPGRDARMRRIATYGQLGPYAWVQLDTGSGADPNGDPKA